MLIGWTINYYYLEIHWYTTFFTIVDVSASTEAFVGTVCLIAVRIKKAIHTRKEQDNSMNRDEGSYQLSPHLQPVRPETERRTAIRQTVPMKASVVEAETSTVVKKGCILMNF